MTLYDHNQSIIASSGVNTTELPEAPPLTDIGDLDVDNPYLKLVEDPVYGLAIRIVVRLPSLDVTEPPRNLQALYPFTDRLNELTIGVQEAFDRYKELAVLRDPLKTSFTLALSIIWLLSVLSAIWLAFVAARKLVAPINDLVEGTKAVAAGDYEKQLALVGQRRARLPAAFVQHDDAQDLAQPRDRRAKPAHGSSAKELPGIGHGTHYLRGVDDR